MSSMKELIENGDLAGVQLAVENDPALLDATVTSRKHSPLMWALHSESGGQPAIAQWLIKRGAKIDLQQNGGWTALMIACCYDQPDTAQMLIERGAKIDLQEKEGCTALMIACRNAQPAIAQWLIERGAKIDLQNKKEWTALMLACWCDQPDTAQMLIERGAKIDLQEKEGCTALMIACRNAQPAIAQWLIERGAKIDLQNKKEWTALMLACWCDQPDTAQMLIERGAKIDLQQNGGWTALMLACLYDQPDTAQMLIERGAKIDLQQNGGWTALMLACQKPVKSHHTAEGLLRCIKLLYTAGADLNLKHGSGKYFRFFLGQTALDKARYSNRADAVAFLSFVETSKVARVLGGELEQPRSVVLAFYEEGLRTTRSCSVLQHEDLVNLGMTSSLKRRLFLQRFNPSAVQLPRQSLPKRASQRIARVLLPPSGTSRYDAFLTHDWGEDGANHEVVSSVNARIRDAGKVTWFDGDRLSGNIIQQITEGIENSRKVVVFITERYMHKLQGDGEDYCKDEFLAATRVRKSRNMISVIVDPTMLDTSLWRGPLQLKLGGNLYIDFTTPAKRVENFSQLLDRINA
ncbi:Ankyrin repeat and KH domain-containing protein 1 [Hondaea fermentalgiana]|uniref:Ankyrin repeat and KH domain-containing protein 1 n=1 Tax=Hondaea fermentalgiana TaxID=2315210 RepID=A0A2R5GVX5_9STRA|nr:Ankyrin repeat and KH domain-containing protein 1 [Hondaea fermentalgiana]|eukprot:GBG33918.1 Ankyrin repeat and KH domain-containing protein 1 [Hondaea fermentalgiana]